MRSVTVTHRDDQVEGSADAGQVIGQPVGDSHSPPPSTTAPSSTGRSPKKRRKVNHACVYCRRSHMTCNDVRPCTRCVKRNIGHLCHDEPRELKKHKVDHSNPQENGHDDQDSSTKATIISPVNGMPNELQENKTASLGPPPLPVSRTGGGPSTVAPSAVSVTRRPMNANSQAFLGVSDWDIPQPQQVSSFTNPYHQQWMFSAPEVSSEFNLLSDFLGNLYSDEIFDTPQSLFESNQRIPNTLGINDFGQQRPTPPNNGSSSNARSGNAQAMDRARENNYYLTAADPSKEVPEERMDEVLKAKVDAGLLKPFNYVKGYARLSQYMEKNMKPSSRKTILSKLDEFRPKFRERTQSLTDFDLVQVEKWFEKSLLECDRVFASMAVPACLWRRTGEIFRGNKEFAELINVPIEHMRDGKLAIYELIVEDSAVSYWQKFGTIAFDTTQKAMLTSCHLKNPDPNAAEKDIHCCFSFTIRRDSYDIPALIIGNFMPINPKKHISNS
ncbi:hypothetical protein FN846DRAFT_779075 [Sphaerosporella brunnea]|uniref:Zn(2)-C6 fungal-type domain-containing protein n=1 Tax=Sphaerosporella brunnea TaxID=1250544 RepID=A0A5J5EVE7_9PEZI|nr:hypothetical protein FN846DRAFT_779075 [Sphaerosporella brunnea]